MDANDSKTTYHRCCKPEIGRGCAFCEAEQTGEPEAILSDGCFKLHETPWLEEYPDNFPTDIFEVRFKNTRRSFYQNVNNLPLKRGDIVAVEASPGHDIGIISLTGDMVAKQMRRTGFNPFNGEFKKIYRKAKPYDIERWQEAIALEHETMIAARQIAADMGLNMKIGDVEYQGDKIKAIFYYIADERVDFRELIKVFAERFHIRIEMKQIGARQEAGRIGGLGACGRELCCASWISSFSSVTTGAARMQDLSLNPQKLAGQCSKLKCCLMYEYDVYAEARREFPRLKEPLQTLDGEYFLVKNDILAGTMTFSTSKDTMANVVTLPVSRVKEIIALNRAGQKVEQLLEAEPQLPANDEPGFRAEEDSITRFDQTKKRNKNRRNRNKNGNRPEGGETAQSQSPEAKNNNDRKPRKQNNNRPATEGADATAQRPSRNNGDKGGRNDNNRRPRTDEQGAQQQRPARGPRDASGNNTPAAAATEGAPAERPAQEGPNEGGERRNNRNGRNNNRRRRNETGEGTREQRTDENRTGDNRPPRENRNDGRPQQPRGNRPPRSNESRARRDGEQREPNNGSERRSNNAPEGNNAPSTAPKSEQ